MVLIGIAGVSATSLFSPAGRSAEQSEAMRGLSADSVFAEPPPHLPFGHLPPEGRREPFRSEDLGEFLDVRCVIDERVSHGAFVIVVELDSAHAAHLQFGAGLGFRAADQVIGDHGG